MIALRISPNLWGMNPYLIDLLPERAAAARPASRCWMPWAILVCLTAATPDSSAADALNDVAAIPRRLPPAGVSLSPATLAALETEATAMATRLEMLRTAFEQDATKTHLQGAIADVEIYTKAVRYAAAHGEFWDEGELKIARQHVERAAARLASLEQGETPWTTQRGLVFRGFRSHLDGSVQPYGVVIPEQLDLAAKTPLYVYLHGRREKMVELQFLDQRHEVGRIHADDAIVLHPFGRYCNAYKSAGEIDVLEAIAHATEAYGIDPDRIALTGFSMGGAGVWHLAAHYPSLWSAASPGAGFAETALYNRLTPDDLPPTYEQRLWHLYDAPSYVRNLFNFDVIAYSGEHDKQIQAARTMQRAYELHGKELTHIVGPGMGHKYHPESLQEILRRLHERQQTGRNQDAERVSLQTRTLRYNRCHWLTILGLERHWEESRVDARQIAESVVLTTQGVTSLRITAAPAHSNLRLKHFTIDGQTVPAPATAQTNAARLDKRRGRWIWVNDRAPSSGKVPGLQGPIDDAFMAPFLVVEPDGRCRQPAVDRWVAFELEHFKERWRRLFRAHVRSKTPQAVNAEDVERFHLILWGDATANSLIARVLPGLPLEWNEHGLRLRDVDEAAAGSTDEPTFPAAHHVPLLIYPNPLNPKRYVVLNSGITFREGHDRTNSLQNPKLPDWAIVDVRRDPDALAPGRIAAADFFDEGWRLRP